MIEEDFNEYKEISQGKKTRRFKLFQNIETKHILLIVALFIAGIILYNKNPDNLKNILLICGGILIVYLLFLFKTNPQKEIIPIDIIVSIVKEKLENEIRQGRYFVHGTTIIPAPFGTLKKVGDVETFTFKWWVGFNIKEPDKSEKQFVIKVDPFNGKIIGILPVPLGFENLDTRDVLFVFPEVVTKELPKVPTA